MRPIKDWWNEHLFKVTFAKRNADTNVLKVLTAVLQSSGTIIDIDNQLVVVPENEVSIGKVLHSMKFHLNSIPFRDKNVKIPSLFKKANAEHYYSMEHNIYLVKLPKNSLQTAVLAKVIFNNLQLNSLDDYVTIFDSLYSSTSAHDQIIKSS